MGWQNPFATADENRFFQTAALYLPNRFRQPNVIAQPNYTEFHPANN